MLNTPDTAMAAQWAALGDWSPLAALKRTSETKWLIDGVIPSGSINWMVAAPSSFKTFLALDMAASIASGRDWHGRETDQAVALYVAGEGDDDIHVRRAAGDLVAGTTGPLCIVQMRPRLDEPHGLASLLGMVSKASGYYLDFDDVSEFETEGLLKYLTPEQARKHDAIQDESKAFKYAVNVARPLFSPWHAALCSGLESITQPMDADLDGMNMFVVIDTYSQTSTDDAKGTVSRYIKTLRDLQDKVAKLGRTLTVLVIDHTTKSGESYMGSLAKLGDSDTMLEVDRRGDDYAVTLRSLKMRGGAKFAPIHLDLVPFTLEGFTDAQDRPLTSLIVSAGEQAHKIRKAAGADSDTAAALVLSLLVQGGAGTKSDLRQRYLTHPTNEGKNAASTARAFLRAMENLTTLKVVLVDIEGLVTLSSNRT